MYEVEVGSLAIIDDRLHAFLHWPGEDYTEEEAREYLRKESRTFLPAWFALASPLSLCFPFPSANHYPGNHHRPARAPEKFALAAPESRIKKSFVRHRFPVAMTTALCYHIRTKEGDRLWDPMLNSKM